MSFEHSHFSIRITWAKNGIYNSRRTLTTATSVQVIMFSTTLSSKECSIRKPRWSFWTHRIIHWEKFITSLQFFIQNMYFTSLQKNPFNCRDELTKIANLCKKYNVLCLSDEVYEWMIYDDNEHIRMNTLPGMWERTITIGSAGKTFSVTGWKTGWAYGPAGLMTNLQMVHQYCVDSCPSLLQVRVCQTLPTSALQ